MLFVIAGLCIAAGFGLADPAAQMMAMLAGATFAVLGVVVRALGFFDTMRGLGIEKRLGTLIGLDAAPCFSTDDLGQIGFQNASAVDRFGVKDGSTLVATLRDHFANPGAVLFRLQSRATKDRKSVV